MKVKGLGLFCCFAAAIGYTIANAFLTEVKNSDPAFVSAVKALWTVVIFLPSFILAWSQGKNVFGSRKAIFWLTIGAVVGQFAGNLAFQWSLKYIGMSLSVPILFGTMVLTATLCGKYFLKEPISKQLAIAILVLIVSTFILNFGAWNLDDVQAQNTAPTNVANASLLPHANLDFSKTRTSKESESSQFLLILAALASSMCGIAYGILGVSIRYFMCEKPIKSTPLIVVGLVGVFGLGLWSILVNGPEILWQSSRYEIGVMSLAGISNAVAFLALTKALELVPVAYVNSINVTQVAMSAVVGIIIFSEPISGWLITGCVLTVIGFYLLNFNLYAITGRLKGKRFMSSVND